MVGLEFLVAADIIHTVAVDFKLSDGGGVVADRTDFVLFLSFTLEMELTGKWPWQNQES